MLFIICSITNDNIIAMMAPRKVRMMFSIMNCQTKTFDEAPKTLRTPISEERSIILLMLMFTRFKVGNNIMNKTNTIITTTIIRAALFLLLIVMKLSR